MGASWLLKLSRGGGETHGRPKLGIRLVVSGEGGGGGSVGGYHKWRSSLPPNNISYLSDKYRTILR